MKNVAISPQGYMGSAGMLLATVGAPFDIGIVARILDEQ